MLSRYCLQTKRVANIQSDFILLAQNTYRSSTLANFGIFQDYSHRLIFMSERFIFLCSENWFKHSVPISKAVTSAAMYQSDIITSRRTWIFRKDSHCAI